MMFFSLVFYYFKLNIILFDWSIFYEENKHTKGVNKGFSNL